MYLINSRMRGKAQAEATAVFRRGVAAFVVGFALWVVDGGFCAELRAVRQSVGLPWAFALELHGWWHVLTAVGAAAFVRLIVMVTAPEEEGLAVSARKRQ